MPETKVQTEDLMLRLLQVFRTVGYDGASLSKLSEATGLQRASLYHRFPGGKQEMAEAVLAYAGAWVQENIVAPLAGAGSPANRVRVFCRTLKSFYDNGRLPCLLDSMPLGTGGDLFGRQVGEAMQTWIGAMAKVAVDAGVTKAVARRRAEEALVRIQGALVVARGTGDPRVFTRQLRELPDALLG